MSRRKQQASAMGFAVYGNSPAQSLMAELRQPLTAAANYVSTAKMILREESDTGVATAVQTLDKAGEQILRAGTILKRLQDCVGMGDINC